MKSVSKAALHVALRLGPLFLALLTWALAPEIWAWVAHQNSFAAAIAIVAKADQVWPFTRLIGPLLVLAGTVYALKDALVGRLSVYAAMAGVGLAAVASLVTGDQADWLIGHYGTWPLSTILARLVLTHPTLPILGGFSILLAGALLGPLPASPVVPIRRAPSNNHGRADWMPIDVARRVFSGPDLEYGGITLGEAYRVDRDPDAREAFDKDDKSTWGQGGTSPLLIDPCRTGPTHALAFMGSGGFKTTAISIPTCLSWTGSAVIFDPARELAPMVRRYRETTLGHHVFMLDPTDPTPSGFDALGWIDIGSPLAEAHIDAVVGWISGETAGDRQETASGATFFTGSGRTLITCIIADILWDRTLAEDGRTLKRVREVLVTPGHAMRGVLMRIHQQSASKMARDLAGTLMELVEETFSGIYGNAVQETRFLSTPAYADLVSGSSFKPIDLCNGKTSVFVQIPFEVLDVMPVIGRLVVGALLQAVYKADGGVQGRVLYLLDEAARLGFMGVLQTARDAGRKYGITILMLYQSIGQLTQQWGHGGKRAWYDSTSWRAFAAIQDPETADELSRVCGEYGVVTTSQGDTSGTSTQRQGGSTSKGRSESHAEQARALIKPHELLQEVRTDEMFVILPGRRPLRCGRAIYFRRPDMRGHVDRSRFK